MQISKIELKEYNQFKNVVFDFTYPKGHADEGKPLKKICVIGQSGTGKTSMLRLIKYFVSRNKQIGPNLHLPSIVKGNVYFEIYQGDIFSRKTSNGINMLVELALKGGKKLPAEEYLKETAKYENSKLPLLINYLAEVVRGNMNNDKSKNEEETVVKIKRRIEAIEILQPKQIVDFAVEEIEKISDFVLKKIKEHRAQDLLHKQQIADVVLKEGSDPKQISVVNKKYEKWLKENANPLEKLAKECLDPILNTFGLRVKTKMDLDSILALGDIQLETLQGVEVPRPLWSTGTRHIVDSALPLFELKPKDAVILMDEPEKSLYPDMQEKIIDFYCGLAPKCQFFFATHSHIVASAFDPWEVFHLEYDEASKHVQLVPNYHGEKHIDNYDYYPKYLRWDSILMKMFKITDEGNEERNKLLVKQATINDQLENMMKNGKTESAQFTKLKEGYISLKKKTGWNAENR